LALVVAGRMAWQAGPAEDAWRNMAHADRVHFADHMDTEQLAQALGGARGLVYPSLFEGFGIPILEAFAAGVPVLTSNCSSMPEVAGDAALLMDPRNVEALAAGMLRLHRDAVLRERLIAAGHKRVQAFSWDGTAQRLWEGVARMARQAGLPL
jgi:glycosyltransferase involved in cell wall biosynthesis